jgi:isoleucyl-tRNA synthetase
MHIRLHAGTVPATASVHLHDWPSADVSLVDADLELLMGQVREFISAGLAIRKEQNIRVRQPLASVTLPLTKELPKDLAELIQEELNVKNILYGGVQGVTLDTHIGTELRAEGFAREIMRTIQDMRKEAGLQVGDKVYCQWFSTDTELVAALTVHMEMIQRDTGLSAFVMQEDRTALTLEKNFDVAPGKPLWIGIQR